MTFNPFASFCVFCLLHLCISGSFWLPKFLVNLGKTSREKITDTATAITRWWHHGQHHQWLGWMRKFETFSMVDRPMDVSLVVFFCGLVGFSWDTFSVVTIHYFLRYMLGRHYTYTCMRCTCKYMCMHTVYALSIFLVPGCSLNSHPSTSEHMSIAPPFKFG